jgi:2-polyprenyl-3-methyl-5-hydroxy-6-metoxy-1,4-benzoquinol methylase
MNKIKTIGKCKICYGEIFAKPILRLKKMPKAAQFFPSKKQFKIDKGINLKVYQCSECGMVQLKSVPVKYYKSVITATSFSKKTKTIRLNEIKKIVIKYKLKKKKIIEIGCGKGAMLDIFKKAGTYPFGMEWNVNSIAYGGKNNKNIIRGFIEDVKKIPLGPFDGFVCYNFLEHLPDPNKAIKNIFNNIKDNALGVITVPNFSYLLKTNCFYEFVPDHLLYFKKKNIKYLFKRNSFQIIECKTINNDNDIQIIVKKITNNKNIEIKKRKTKRLNLLKKYKKVENLIKNLKSIVIEYKNNNKKIAVWGAGHRTLALLSLSNLHEIEYIIDSADFKQGKYAPILHKKIVHPDFLRTNKVDLLIIMVPGIYPDEVAKYVANMRLGINIIKLNNNKIIHLN